MTAADGANTDRVNEARAHFVDLMTKELIVVGVEEYIEMLIAQSVGGRPDIALEYSSGNCKWQWDEKHLSLQRKIKRSGENRGMLLARKQQEQLYRYPRNPSNDEEMKEANVPTQDNQFRISIFTKENCKRRDTLQECEEESPAKTTYISTNARIPVHTLLIQ